MTTENNRVDLKSEAPQPIKNSLGDNIAQFWLSALIDSANDAIISKNLNGIITSWNPGAERIFGWTAEEAVGQSILLVIPTEYHSEEKIIIGKIKAGERVEHYETIRHRKDHSRINVALTVSPIKDASGTIIGASKIARDITQIKQAEEKRRIAEERYQTLFNLIDEGFCIIQMIFDESGKAVDYLFLEINPTFEKQTGLSGAKGKTMRELVPNHDESWFEIYGKVALTGEPIRFENRAEVLDRWFDLYAFRVGEPEDRKLGVIFKNISDQKRAEAEREHLLQQLEIERSRLSYLFEKAPAFVAATRGETHIFEVANPAYLRLLGNQDVIGKTAHEVLLSPEIQGQGFYEPLDTVYQSGEAFIGQELPISFQRQPNELPEQRFVNFVYQPIFEVDGAVSGIFIHGVDVTEQVLARQDAEAANRAKDEFLATLSHELRTPLNAILGWARILEENNPSEDMRVRALKTIQRNVQVQSNLIDDILDVSRIISGKLKLEMQPVELSSLIESAIEAVLPAAQGKEIRLQNILNSDGKTMVCGDPNRLQQVVWNLLSNAVKFTPDGGNVKITLQRLGSQAEIVVKDSGIGIPPDVLPFVFDRFRQADSTTTRRHGGLGLGLAIVRHITEMHGGTVEAESAGDKQGASFIIKLPLMFLRGNDISTDEAFKRAFSIDLKNVNQSPSLIQFEYTPELNGLHVLIVDDEEDGRDLVKTVLEQCGAKVTEAASAAAGFKALQELQPDILISDLGMPEEDGYSLIQKIRQLPPDKGGEIPAAALTAYARTEDRMRVLRAGFQIYLPKPVEPTELLAVVANLGERR